MVTGGRKGMRCPVPTAINNTQTRATRAHGRAKPYRAVPSRTEPLSVLYIVHLFDPRTRKSFRLAHWSVQSVGSTEVHLRRPHLWWSRRLVVIHSSTLSGVYHVHELRIRNPAISKQSLESVHPTTVSALSGLGAPQHRASLSGEGYLGRERHTRLGMYHLRASS